MELGKTPKEIRQAIRQGRYTGGTAGLAPGYVQANLVILPPRAGLRLPRLLPAQPPALPPSRSRTRAIPEPTAVARRAPTSGRTSPSTGSTGTAASPPR